MTYVVYNTDNSKIVVFKHGKQYFKTEAAAKAAKTRADKAGHKGEYAVMHLDIYRVAVEKMHQVTNHMTGEKVWESINTPYYLSVSSETYWCS